MPLSDNPNTAFYPTLAAKVPLTDATGTITGNWNLTPSKARAYLTTANQVIESSTPTKVTLNAESYDVNSEFDIVTNYRFTAKIAGYYISTGLVTFAATLDTKIYIAQIYVNGALKCSAANYAGDTDGVGISISDIFYLAIGEYVELYAYHVAGINQELLLGSNYSYLSIHKLS